MPEPYETFDDQDWIYEGYKELIPAKTWKSDGTPK